MKPPPLSTAAVIGALGTVYGDIGTSPLYAFRETLHASGDATAAGVLGVLSLTFRSLTLLLASLGAALFYCDALITPAISVLSAVEGLELLSPGFHGTAVPVTIAIVVVLFAVQYQGTGRIGRSFGYVMIVWFAALAVMGAVAVARHPTVLGGMNLP